MQIPEASSTGPAGAGPEIRRLLRECGSGEEGAFERLFSLVYEDLREIARRRLGSEGDDVTLDTAGLVHESYLSLAAGAQPTWQDRAHFMAVASRVMRNILVDHARKRRARKRGGGDLRVTLYPHMVVVEEATVDLLALDDALSRLAAHSDRMAYVVECRFFGAMTVEETAEALAISPRSVERDWTRAKAYLYEQLGPG